MRALSDAIVRFLNENRGQAFTARQIAVQVSCVEFSRSVAMACQRLIAHREIESRIHRPLRYIIPKS